MTKPSQHRFHILWLSWPIIGLAATTSGCHVRTAAPPRDVAYIDIDDQAPVAEYAPSPSYQGYVMVVDGATGRRVRIPR